jgi:hypothetical protein
VVLVGLDSGLTVAMKNQKAADTKRVERRKKGSDTLAEEWNRRLSVLNEPGAHERLDVVIAARGRLKRRPKAGSSY